MGEIERVASINWNLNIKKLHTDMQLLAVSTYQCYVARNQGSKWRSVCSTSKTIVHWYLDEWIAVTGLWERLVCFSEKITQLLDFGIIGP